jgi:formylglycine-generating enzyme required for sulfatase activity
MGIKDVWAHLTKDTESIDWSRKGELEYAKNIVFNESCKECHINLYPEGITDQGITAHLYYDDNEQKLNLQCISCHLDAGHYNPNYKHESLKDVFKPNGKIYESAAEITSFENFMETIPGTAASISMIAVPGGEFTIGSPSDEPFRKENEGPQRKVKVSPFFMGEVEVTWDQFWAFYSETMSEGRTPPAVIYANNSREDIDAVSGPTPPFGLPDQGWGMGSRPAITMTHYSAQTFCQWLSLKTGRKYRLPTEAEWEYAARGGTATPYFFEGNPKKLSNEGFLKSIFKPDTTGIYSHAVYVNNSGNRTQEPSEARPNPFGLKNMLGNVMEYCSDWYAEDAYKSVSDGELDPKGPSEGTEHVVRGGHYNSDAAELRSAARSHTEHDDWLRTDPQNPKSIWWYSDVKGIGFRVVCEVPEHLK